MRYLAIHDQHGSIASLIAGPADGPAMVVALEAGQQATEVDLAESGLDLSAFESEESAVKALDAFQVDVKREARLVRRGGDRA